MDNSLEQARNRKYREYLKAELEAAALYKAMTKAERDVAGAGIFESLEQAELRHASRWAGKLGIAAGIHPVAQPRLKLRLLKAGVRVFGPSRMLGWLLRSEARLAITYASDPEARDLAAEERRHARVLRQLTVDNRDPLAAIRSGRASLFGGGGGLRAAVLGVNDGLVSNFSLVMGVAGGTSRPEFILLAGVAGLLAGAFSMAAGEFISVRSQRDVYEHRIHAEEAEIELWPDEEEEELVLIYQAKGFSEGEAKDIARQIMQHPKAALETMVREELGLDPSQLGSPSGAAISSFAAFIGGAIIPILPYIFDAGYLAFTLSAVLSAVALLGVGGLLAALTGRNATWGGMRMLLAGGAAAGVTYAIGRLIGVTVVG